MFFETGFLCVALADPGTHVVDQAGLELRNLPASASQVLGLKACATTPGLIPPLLILVYTNVMKLLCHTFPLP